MPEDIIRPRYKRDLEKMSVLLAGAERRAKWAQMEAKAAKYDLLQAEEKIKTLEARLAEAKRNKQLPLDMA